MKSWLDDLQAGAQVIVHFAKAGLPELERVPAYVERISGRGCVIVKYVSCRHPADRFIDGQNREAFATLEAATPEALAAIEVANRHAKLVRLFSQRARNLDYVRTLDTDRLEALLALLDPPAVNCDGKVE